MKSGMRFLGRNDPPEAEIFYLPRSRRFVCFVCSNSVINPSGSVEICSANFNISTDPETQA
eukprot:5362234-Ditylum_brightwellii.AAC.1